MNVLARATCSIENTLAHLLAHYRYMRALDAGQRAGGVVNLLAGTYYVNNSLVFTPADSGAAGAPVTWQVGRVAACVSCCRLLSVFVHAGLCVHLHVCLGTTKAGLCSTI